jgi:hypothetical protein
MAKQIRIAAAVLGLAGSLAAGSAFAQAQPNQQGQYGQQGLQSQQGMQGQQGMQNQQGMQAQGMQRLEQTGLQGAGIGGVGGQQSFVAPVPQYWVSDASIFIRNAANTARTMTREQSLNVQAPQVIGSQAQFIVNSTGRALADLNGLLQNAEATNPSAVPQIRQAMAELVAAQTQAHQVFQQASQGDLAPGYAATLQTALTHLQASERQLGQIWQAYGGRQGAQQQQQQQQQQQGGSQQGGAQP